MKLEPVLTIRPKDCTDHCDYGECDCSGEWQVQGYTKESVDALVAQLAKAEAVVEAARAEHEIKYLTIPQLRERFGENWTEEVGRKSAALTAALAALDEPPTIEVRGDGSGHTLPPLVEGYSTPFTDQVALVTVVEEARAVARSRPVSESALEALRSALSALDTEEEDE